MSIKAFPMDSQVTEMGEDGLPVYDRQFGAQDLREVMQTYFGDGYFAEDGTSMNVKPGDGLNVVVQSGKVNVRGTLGYMDEDATVRLDNPDTTYSRIDTIAARLDLSIAKRSIELVSVMGTAAASPVAPSLTRTDTVWELGLADVTVPANATLIDAANVKDTRLDPDRCGVAEPFAKLDTTSLFEQVTAIVTNAQSEIQADVDKLSSATDAAVSAMDDALSSTVLGSVWRLSSTASTDYLSYGDDLNKITSACTRFSEGASVTGGVLNKPSSVTGAFVLYTFAAEEDPTRLGQMLLTCDSGGVAQWTRSGAGSAWTSWENPASAALAKFPVATADIADKSVTLAKLASGVDAAIRSGFKVHRFDLTDSTAENTGASFDPTGFSEFSGYYVEDIKLLIISKLAKRVNSAIWSYDSAYIRLPSYIPRTSKTIELSEFMLEWDNSNYFKTWTGLRLVNGYLRPHSSVPYENATAVCGVVVVPLGAYV